MGKQPGLTVITYCRGSIPLIHAILFSRLHCQLMRKLYWRHVTCSDTELVTPEENRHLIFDYQSFNANIIWHLSSCIAIIRNKTMYFKQRCTIKRHTAMQYSKTWLWRVLGFFFIRNSLDIISAYNKFIFSAYNEFVIEIITNLKQYTCYPLWIPDDFIKSLNTKSTTENWVYQIVKNINSYEK